MFEKPQPIPSGTNRLLLIWTYVVNDDEIRQRKRVQHPMMILI